MSIDFQKALNRVAQGVVYTGDRIKAGVLYLSQGTSRALYDLTELKEEGAEKWSKAAIANLKAISRLYDTTVFKGVIQTLDAHKDLYYATKVIGSLADWCKTGRLAFPRNDKEAGKPLNWSAILYTFANICDTGKFLQKYGVFEFKWLSEMATKVGSYQVSFLGRKFEDIPVLGNLCSTPKDFFIFVASGLEIWKEFKSLVYAPGNTPQERADWRCSKVLDLVFLFKIVGSIGKIILIGFGRHYSKTVWFCIVDVATQNASLFKYWLDRSRKRQERIAHSTAPAA